MISSSTTGMHNLDGTTIKSKITPGIPEIHSKELTYRLGTSMQDAPLPFPNSYCAPGICCKVLAIPPPADRNSLQSRMAIGKLAVRLARGIQIHFR